MPMGGIIKHRSTQILFTQNKNSQFKRHAQRRFHTFANLNRLNNGKFIHKIYNEQIN